jgi:hypothetical protein
MQEKSPSSVRVQILLSCAHFNIPIHTPEWTKYFNRHAQSYRLFQEQMPISPLIHIPAGRKALSAFDMLTVIGLIPAIPNQNFLGEFWSGCCLCTQQIVVDQQGIGLWGTW